DTMKRAGSMARRGVSATAVTTANRSASARLMIEVLSVGDHGQLSGRALEGYGGRYRITSVPVEAQLTAGSVVLMGGAADIKPRAVLQLSGRYDDNHRVRVARAVVLTGYVTVER